MSKDLKDVLDIIAKLLIPIAIAFFTINQTKENNKLIKFNHDNDILLKYIEISWESISSNDTIKINNTLNLLNRIDKDVAYTIANIISTDTLQPSSIQQKANDLVKMITHNSLSNLDLDIIVWKRGTYDEGLLKRIIQLLKEESPHLTTTVNRKIIPSNTHFKVTPQIRFHSKDQFAATLIKEKIEMHYPTIYLELIKDDHYAIHKISLALEI